MSKSLFLCYENASGVRGYIPPHTPYTLEYVSVTQCVIRTDYGNITITTGTANTDCTHALENEAIGFVIKEEDALKWVLCGVSDNFIGGNNC